MKDTETVILFLRTLNHVRSFRWRHWLFAREYIIRRTPHPTATGGSPIVTVSCFHATPDLAIADNHEQWLPNQLSAVMDMMISIYESTLAPLKAQGSDGYDGARQKLVEPMMDLVRDQKEKLAKEVEKWCKERGV
jgi:indoleamine 2,3-dioxygenase